MTVGPERLGARSQVAGRKAKLREELLVAERRRAPRHRAGHATAGQRAELLCRRQRHAAGGRRGEHGGGQGVLGTLLEGRRYAEDLVLGEPRAGYDGRDVRLPLGEGAGFVHYQGVDLLERLERLGVPDQHT